MIKWPRLLVPDRSYSIKASGNAIRTQMDSGRYRQRQRQTRLHRMMRVEWELSDDEYGYFQSIYKHLLENGTAWFEMSLPMGDDGFKCYTVRFVAIEGHEAQYRDVMFWKVKARLETEDQTEPLDACCTELQNLINFDLEGFTTAVDDFITAYEAL